MLDRFNRIVLAANPSFATEKESRFWTHFGRICEREGWRLFKHSMRKIPSDDHTMILPARLSDVAGFIKNLPAGIADGQMPVWLKRGHFDQIIEWEIRRWKISEHSPRLDQGLTRLAWHVDHLFKTLNPAGTIVCNKIDHGTALFYWAAMHYGSTPVFFERSPLDTFLIEDRGMFAESAIWDQYATEIRDYPGRYLSHGQIWLDYLSQNPEGFRPQKFEALEEVRASLRKITGRKFFLPMDNTLWTGWAQDDHWQGKIDYYSGTPSPSEAIRLLASVAAKFGATLVVKKHPSDVQEYADAGKNVIFVNAPLDVLIKECDICLCFLTKVAFVAAAMGKPTVTLAPNTAAVSGALFHATRTKDWERVIGEAVAASPDDLTRRKASLQNLLGWLDQTFYLNDALPADLSKPSPKRLLTKITSGPAGCIAAGSISAMDNKIAATMDRFAAKKVWPRTATNDESKIHMVFDVSRLANTRLRYSGISRFAHKVFSLIGDMPGVERIAVLGKPHILSRGMYANNLDGFSDYLGAKVLRPDEVAPRVNGKNAVYYSPYDELVRLPGLNLPRIATVHDVLHVTASEWYIDPAARRHIDAVLDSIGECDTVITVSEFTRMQLMRVKAVAPERVITVHLAADEAFRPACGEKIADFRRRANIGPDPYFVVFGQFEFRKNLPTTLTAIRMAVENGSNARFVVIGSAIGSDAMLKALYASGLDQDRVVFLSGPSDEEVATAYSGANGMIYASLAEGFGLPVVEALNCGCPVITSAVTSIPEVAGDGALYVDPYNVYQILDAIRALERSESLQAKLRASALKRSSRFTWARTADGVVQVAREALARGASPTPETISHEAAEARSRQQLLTFCSWLLLADTTEDVESITENAALGRALSSLPETDVLRLHYDRIIATRSVERGSRPMLQPMLPTGQHALSKR